MGWVRVELTWLVIQAVLKAGWLWQQQDGGVGGVEGAPPLPLHTLPITVCVGV